VKIDFTVSLKLKIEVYLMQEATFLFFFGSATECAVFVL